MPLVKTNKKWILSEKCDKHLKINKYRKGTFIMESVSAYFLANPAAFTLLAIFVVVLILYFILSKLIKLAIVFLIVVLLVGGVYLFKDPSTTPDKIKQSVATFKTGGEAIGDKFSRFWQDTKELAGKAKEVPGEINKLLGAADEDVKKEYKKK